MWVASTHLRAGLIKLEKQGRVFYGFCMVRKALGLMEMGPRKATQGELQGELHAGVNPWRTHISRISSDAIKTAKIPQL